MYEMYINPNKYFDEKFIDLFVVENMLENEDHKNIFLMSDVS